MKKPSVAGRLRGLRGSAMFAEAPLSRPAIEGLFDFD